MNAAAILDRILRTSNGDWVFDDGIRLDTQVNWGPQHPQGCTAMVVFKAFHDALFPEGISDFAVAAGEGREQALGKACSTWLEGTAPVLQALVNKECRHDCVDAFDVAVVSSANKQPSNWEMLRGPLQTMGYDTEWADVALRLNDCILKTIIDACSQTGVFAGTQPHSVRWSIARSPGEPYRGECRLDGEPWQAGGDALRAVTRIMTKHFHDAADFHIARQFCVCRPSHRSCPVAERAALAQLAAMERQTPKRWWQLWK